MLLLGQRLRLAWLHPDCCGVAATCQVQKGRRPKPTPFYRYIFFSSHILVVAFHVPPAFAQSASVFAAVTSPAKAGPVKASARVTAKVAIRIFMTLSPFGFELTVPVCLDSNEVQRRTLIPELQPDPSLA